jgi:23S rRNA pseudouridine955/2504/2580 synthase
MKTELLVTNLNYRKRLDKFLQKELNIPYSAVMRLIREGKVRINGTKVRDNSFSLALDDVVETYHRYVGVDTDNKIKPINLNLAILYEDEDYAVLSKPSGLAVQGGSKIGVSLLNHLSYSFETPFLVHRLDKGTSGVIVVAKHLKASRLFMNIMKERKINKVYLALLKGKLSKEKVSVSTMISNKNSHTLFLKRKTYGDFATLVEAKIFTGRKHQIRIHSSEIGNPVAGDKKYGDFIWNRQLFKIGLKRIFLHAFHIDFVNPLNGHKISVNSSLPDDLKIFLEKL